MNRSQSQNTWVQKSDEYIYGLGSELYTFEKYTPSQFFLSKYASLKEKNDITKIETEFLEAISGLVLFQSDAPAQVAEYIKNYPSHPLTTKASFELANFWFSKKDFTKAISYYSLCDLKFLNEDEVQDLNFRTAYSYFNKKDFANSLSLFNKLKSGKNKYTYASSYYAGFIDYKSGAYETALLDLKKAQENESYKALVPYILVNVLYKMKRYNEIISYNDTIKAKIPSAKNIEEVNFLVGEAYFQKGGYKKADEFFSKTPTPQFITQSNDILYRLAYTKYMNNDLDGSLPVFKKLAESNDSIGQYSAYYLGQSYLKNGNKTFAANAFNQSRNMKFIPAIQVQSSFYFAKITFESEKFGEAIDAFKQYFTLVGNGKKEEEANDLLGESLLNNNDLTEAVEYIEKLPSRTVKINAIYQKVTFYKGIELFNDEKYPEAIELFEKSLKSPMDNLFVADASYWIAESYSIGKRWDDALIYYQKMQRTKGAEKSDSYIDSKYGIAYALFNTKEFSKAYGFFKDFLESDSKTRANSKNKVDATVRLGDCSYALKKYSDALSYYEKAIELNSSDQDYIYFQKGVVNDISGKSDLAIQNFKYVVAKYAPSPYYEPSYFRIGQILFEQGNYTPCIDQFTQFIRNFPASALISEAYLKRAIAYSNVKDNESAIADFSFIISNFPQSASAPDALQGIQEALTNVGRAEDFATLMAKFKETNPTVTGLEKLEFENAKTLYFDQKYEKAIVLFANLIKDYPTGKYAVEINYYLADSYYRTGRPDAAQTYYQTVLDVGNTTPFYNKALQKTAESYFNAKSYAEAGGFYKKLLYAASNKKEFYFAYAGLMQVEFERANFDSCIFYANKALEKGNVSANAANKANLYLSKSYLLKQDTSSAIDYILTLKNSAKDENAAEAQFMLAKIFFNQKKNKQSLESLFELNENFSIYSKWIGVGFLLIADNYSVLKEYYQAKSTLKSIVDNFPDQTIVEAAKLKITQIDELEKGGENDAQ